MLKTLAHKLLTEKKNTSQLVFAFSQNIHKVLELIHLRKHPSKNGSGL